MTPKFKLVETEDIKVLRSKNTNYNFCKKTGYCEMWGNKKEDDIIFSEVGPFILDIEVTTICKQKCKFCYKNNTSVGTNMSLEKFKTIFDKINKHKILTQIAIGVDSSATSNPDLWQMMKYSRDNGVIPNITVANISDETADKIVEIVGACAVSFYGKNKSKKKYFRKIKNE